MARTLISVSGIAIIAAVCGIGLFLAVEILPLLSRARLAPSPAIALLGDEPAHAVIVDEHQQMAMVIGSAPAARVVALAGSAEAGAAAEALPLPGLEGQRVTAAGQVPREPRVALGTEQGSVWIGTVELTTAFEGSQRMVHAVVEPEWTVEATPGVPIAQIAWRPTAQGAVIATLAESGAIVVTRLRQTTPLVGEPKRTLESLAVPAESGARPVALALDGRGVQLTVGTADGQLMRWALRPDGAALLERVRAAAGVSAMATLLGDRSLLVGGQDGSLAAWSLVRDGAAADGWRLARTHAFRPHRGPVRLIAPSPRDKGFLTLAQDGTGRLHYLTSERTLGQIAAGASPQAAVIAPKTDGALVIDGQGALRRWAIHSPHPEVSWRALFGKVWYEGYPRPDYIWQSTGGTDDFESKFSLIPLAFGTLKGTCYALLLAVPLALGGALYCSQFLEKRLRNPVKSTIELMAALPSVVLGFVAGVLLAPLVQAHLVAVLAAPLIIGSTAVLGMLASQAVPVKRWRGLCQRQEFWLLLAWIGAGILVTRWAGPWIERRCFGGDFQTWLLRTTGERYDQRNSLVVGWAMGFAVIPLIFTICEDAFSAVPKHLVGASLACGASRWQTAWRVVLPAAGSGVFSAIMIGFGRAIGETMVVLMATGNTPIMDWSMFNGFRALSANIAVEIPEAPYGGTLYRVLMVAALLLFTMTFAVNTVAELIRLRLRARLKGL